MVCCRENIKRSIIETGHAEDTKMDTELAYAEVHRKLYEKYQLLNG